MCVNNLNVMCACFHCNISIFCSMAGKHIFEVPPTSVGGLTSCIGVGARGLDSQKVVHADFSHLLPCILQLQFLTVYVSGKACYFSFVVFRRYFRCYYDFLIFSMLIMIFPFIYKGF